MGCCAFLFLFFVAACTWNGRFCVEIEKAAVRENRTRIELIHLHKSHFIVDYAAMFDAVVFFGAVRGRSSWSSIIKEVAGRCKGIHCGSVLRLDDYRVTFRAAVVFECISLTSLVSGRLKRYAACTLRTTLTVSTLHAVTHADRIGLFSKLNSLKSCHPQRINSCAARSASRVRLFLSVCKLRVVSAEGTQKRRE